MERKQLCVANVKYKKPTADDAQRAKNLLKYLTYRDSRDGYVKQRAGMERWVDHGLGGSVGAIAQRCDDLRSEHVLTFSLVINPNPELTAMIPFEQRERFVRELTENVVEGFFDERGLDTGIEYSYVLHHRNSTDPQSPGLHDPHTHVVLPGTVFDEEHGQRVPLFFSQNRKVDHIDMLHRVTEHETAVLLERYIGPDWEQRYDALDAARTAQRAITEEPAHGAVEVENDGFDFWVGARRTDEQTSATGYYRTIDDDEVEFRPLIGGLKHDEAELLAQLLYSEIGGDFAALRQLADGINAMNRMERAAFFADVRRLDFSPPDLEPDLDIDIDL
ncbi:MAG: hypothetical protein IPO91_04510 [Chloroflexi bacterium]|nr:hypothetical protein [Chloroflexota bacterium]